METITVFLNTINTILFFYIAIITIRIFLSWFPGYNRGAIADFIFRITNPYLNFFRRLRFLRFGNIDFSPAMGILLLYIIHKIISDFVILKQIHIGTIMAVIVIHTWAIVAFFINFFIIIIIIKVIMELSKTNTMTPFTYFINQLLNPVLYFFSKYLFNFKSSAIAQLLGVGIVFLIISIGGNGLVGIVARYLCSLPA